MWNVIQNLFYGFRRENFSEFSHLKKYRADIMRRELYLNKVKRSMGWPKPTWFRWVVDSIKKREKEMAKNWEGKTVGRCKGLKFLCVSTCTDWKQFNKEEKKKRKHYTLTGIIRTVTRKSYLFLLFALNRSPNLMRRLSK